MNAENSFVITMKTFSPNDMLRCIESNRCQSTHNCAACDVVSREKAAPIHSSQFLLSCCYCLSVSAFGSHFTWTSADSTWIHIAMYMSTFSRHAFSHLSLYAFFGRLCCWILFDVYSFQPNESYFSRCFHSFGFPLMPDQYTEVKNYITYIDKIAFDYSSDKGKKMCFLFSVFFSTAWSTMCRIDTKTISICINAWALDSHTFAFYRCNFTYIYA